MKQLTTLFFFFGLFQFSYAQNRVITTGVPFLNIAPDARSAALGDQGVATSADAFSNHWNPAKFAFAPNEIGVAISYTPYLSKLVNDIFLADLTYYRAIDDRSAWAVGLRYFSLGEIITGNTAEEILNNPLILRPNEFVLDASYALKLNDKFSMAVQASFLTSDLKLPTGNNESVAASTVSVGISGFYESYEVPYSNFSGIWRAGFNISNIGPKLKYEDEGESDFLPTNLKFGGGFDFIFDSYNKLNVSLEFNKLLVPSPSEPVTDKDGNITGYKQPSEVGVLSGIFKSFGDAPDGFNEELKEFTWALGAEFMYDESFALRAGYFNENELKGARKFITLGAGFKYNTIDIDLSYLISATKVVNPLENTLRFSLTFNFGEERY
ncbi:MAG: type IX secretion system outer membrane channel protein PorV [Bacteroidetes bacterium]|nr:type IX secretion system outer membrane channel protein PorV [Bacteroidota bacterium]MDA0888403.1 type IX secretion system outer membrane channel protein PorV [Bacteroidota bacterium]MDA1084463.1 type IX secretion system outer membrane channel protein PorV [Bacteroidota bacterium]